MPLLQDAAALEEAGLLLRVPDWWKKRARPAMKVTVGGKVSGALGAEAVLDFKFEAALDGETLSDAEWRRLPQSDSGLVLLKGRWVEVDREKLAQAAGVIAKGEKGGMHKTPQGKSRRPRHPGVEVAPDIFVARWTPYGHQTLPPVEGSYSVGRSGYLKEPSAYGKIQQTAT